MYFSEPRLNPSSSFPCQTILASGLRRLRLSREESETQRLDQIQFVLLQDPTIILRVDTGPLVRAYALNWVITPPWEVLLWTWVLMRQLIIQPLGPAQAQLGESLSLGPQR